jgi:hypothetical protein
MKNKKLSGKVGHVDLEGGYYTLTTSGGEIFKLDGGGADLHVPGAQAEVEGQLDQAGFGIGFGTPVLHVKSYKVKQ